MRLRALNGAIRDWRSRDSRRRGSSLMTMIHTASSRVIEYRDAATTIAVHRSTASRVTYRVGESGDPIGEHSLRPRCEIHLINPIYL